MSDLFCYVNGQRTLLPPGKGEYTLLEYLREGLFLTGAKLGCGEGGCGACTVMVSKKNPVTGSIEHRSINACLCPIYAVVGCHVVTVEGIGSTKTRLHPVQERIAHAHGSQCGFCTPGFVMSMYSLLREKNGCAITEEEIEENLAGNLCRCTGYRPILDAFRPFAQLYTESHAESSGIGDVKKSRGNICPSTGRPCDCKRGECDGETTGNGLENTFCGDLITPIEIIEGSPVDFRVMGSVVNWFRPVSLESLLALKSDMPDAKIVAGNTEVGIEMKFKHAKYRNLIHVGCINEMLRVEVMEDAVVFGSAVTLSTLMRECRRLACQLDEGKQSVFRAFAEQLKWFAGPPIRNCGTIGGNIVTASPISDLNPLWIASKAVFTVVGKERGTRHILASEFFLGYRKVDITPDEVLMTVSLPFTKPFEYVKEFKQAQRREDDIAIVNCGVRVAFGFDQVKQMWLISDCSLAYGGVSSVTVSASDTASYLLGKSVSNDTIHDAMRILNEEVMLQENAPGGRIGFRRSLVLSFFVKGLVHAAKSLQNDTKDAGHMYVLELEEGMTELSQTFHRPPSGGIQYFSTTGHSDIVGTPVQHASAELQATGEAKYVDDLPKTATTLHAALILSDKAHAIIKSIDSVEASKMEGVIAIHFAEDIPGKNVLGPVLKDEELFASSVVTCVGQPIGIVTALTRAQALEAARAVKISYDDLDYVLTIEEAIEKNSFYDLAEKQITRGDVQEGLDRAGIVSISGTVRMGGQEHFYLEPNAHIVDPMESGEIISHSSTQCPQKHQQYISQCLGIPAHKIVVKTKRAGGGFGGKETRAAFVNTAVAIPAYLLGRPVSLVLDRDTDMSITGHRHPFMARYRAACDQNGKLVAVDVEVYNNAGNSLDLSASVMDRALLSLDSVYNIPNYRVKGIVCRTNLPSNTAFRGFGAPQGMMIMESIMDKFSKTTGIDRNRLTEINMYSEGDLTPYGQVLRGCQARQCWDEALRSAGGLAERQEAINSFNNCHKYRKKGLAVIPTKFGISFTLKFLNQAGALVHIYQSDGSVLVSHGGVEMGQGLHTKVCQIVAHELKVPIGKVHISETSTDKVPNATATAASASSDLYGAAAVIACAELNDRLKPYREMFPDASFTEIVQKAYFDRVDLSAHGFYKTPDITDFPGGNMPFNYFTYGTAVTEVELDILTGDWHIIRSDVVMDVGQSLNPAIDIGQIEGAFVQGMGWSCLEELVWGDNQHQWIAKTGSLFSCGPGTYKIPTANDIPIDFRVTLLRNSPCERTPLVHSSKAVGEPPFFLGTSVFWALKNAIYASREDSGIHGWFNLDSPCTPERLRMSCEDVINKASSAGNGEIPKLSC